MRIDIHLHIDPITIRQSADTATQHELELIMATLDEIIADVSDESTQIDSLATLTAGIKAQLDAALSGQLTPEQQAKVDQIFAAVDANKAKVVAAINANTTTAPSS